MDIIYDTKRLNIIDFIYIIPSAKILIFINITDIKIDNILLILKCITYIIVLLHPTTHLILYIHRTHILYRF